MLLDNMKFNLFDKIIWAFWFSYCDTTTYLNIVEFSVYVYVMALLTIVTIILQFTYVAMVMQQPWRRDDFMSGRKGSLLLLNLMQTISIKGHSDEAHLSSITEQCTLMWVIYFFKRILLFVSKYNLSWLFIKCCVVHPVSVWFYRLMKLESAGLFF